MTAEQIIREHLPTRNVMQLATAKDNQPWACTVHYYSDSDLNLYWISTPNRRHSLEIENNNKVSVAVMVHENTPDEDYVIGIAIEGTAKQVAECDEKILMGYRAKHHKGETFVEDMKSGNKPYKVYMLTSKKFVLFDTKNFPEHPRQEWELR